LPGGGGGAGVRFIWLPWRTGTGREVREDAPYYWIGFMYCLMLSMR